jgi:hypothetical protein
MRSTDGEVFRLAAALFTVIDPVYAGGRFYWHLAVLGIDRFYCPDCHACVARGRLLDRARLVAAGAAHVCPALIEGAATYVPEQPTPTIEPKGDCSHGTTERVHEGVSREDGR